MYRINDITAGLEHLVGWEQSWDENNQIDSDLTQTESGLYYQQVHPMLTLENMKAVMPSGWTGGFDAYLAKTARDGIVKAVQTFIGRKVKGRMSRNLMEHRSLFNGLGRFTDTIENRGDFVGFEIQPLRSDGIAVRLDRIGLQMKGAEGVVRVYLFRSSQQEPVAYWDVNFTSGAGAFVWLDLGTDGPVIVRDDLPGEKWYLGYFQSLLPRWMDAINYARDWSRPPCMQCNRGNPAEWEEMNRYFHVAPFTVTVNTVSVDYDGDFSEDFTVTLDDVLMLWNPSDVVYTSGFNYGINFTYTVGCDLTDFIIRQRDIFAEVVQKQVAYDALKAMAVNPEVRVNRNQLNAAQILADLDGEPALRKGIAGELSKAYDVLDLDTSGLDPICLGCRNKGVRYGQA